MCTCCGVHLENFSHLLSPINHTKCTAFRTECGHIKCTYQWHFALHMGLLDSTCDGLFSFCWFTSFDGRPFCWKTILMKEFLLFTSASPAKTSSFNWVLSTDFSPSMRRTTKYPLACWAPLEFSPSNEEKVHCFCFCIFYHVTISIYLIRWKIRMCCSF